MLHVRHHGHRKKIIKGLKIMTKVKRKVASGQTWSLHTFDEVLC